jgi:hypothetical protein
MEDSSTNEGGLALQRVEEKIAELEKLSEELGRVPDAELSTLLERAVGLVDEINTGIERRITDAGAESGEVEGLLDRVDFGAFDAALGSLEREGHQSRQNGGAPEEA